MITLETKYISPNSTIDYPSADYSYWISIIRKKGKNGTNALTTMYTVTKPTKKQLRNMKKYVRSSFK